MLSWNVPFWLPITLAPQVSLRLPWALDFLLWYAPLAPGRFGEGKKYYRDHYDTDRTLWTEGQTLFARPGRLPGHLLPNL